MANQISRTREGVLRDASSGAGTWRMRPIAPAPGQRLPETPVRRPMAAFFARPRHPGHALCSRPPRAEAHAFGLSRAGRKSACMRCRFGARSLDNTAMEMGCRHRQKSAGQADESSRGQQLKDGHGLVTVSFASSPRLACEREPSWSSTRRISGRPDLGRVRRPRHGVASCCLPLHRAAVRSESARPPVKIGLLANGIGICRQSGYRAPVLLGAASSLLSVTET